LRITHGAIDIGSLFTPGYAHGAAPDWRATQALAAAAALL
jgi:hypothetical protein